MLGSFWDNFGINLGSFWDHFGMTLGSILDHFGMTLGSYWDHFGMTLGSLWGHFGVTLASLLYRSRVRTSEIKCCERRTTTSCQNTYPQRTGRNDGRQHVRTLYHFPSNKPPSSGQSKATWGRLIIGDHPPTQAGWSKVNHF